MAITGTGTELDPYVVHDYSELVAVQVGKGVYWSSTSEHIYILLDSDIDTSGETWVDPKSPSGTYDYALYHLNLGGHSWSNISLTKSDRLFYGYELYNGTFDGLVGHEMQAPIFMGIHSVHDLTILNSECDFIPDEWGYGYYYEACFMFFNCELITRCNINGIMHFPDETQVSYGTNYNGYSVFYACTTIEYNDINVLCDGNHAYYERNVNKLSRQGIFKSCTTVRYNRLTGNLTDSTVPITGFIARDCGLDYCVIDFDFSECTLADASVDCGLGVLVGSTSVTTVMNTDSLAAAGLYNKFTAGDGVTACTYSEIRTGDILRNQKSFPVSNDLTSDVIWKIIDGDLPFQGTFPQPEPPAPSHPSIWLRTGGTWAQVQRVRLFSDGDWTSIPVKNRKGGAWEDQL